MDSWIPLSFFPARLSPKLNCVPMSLREFFAIHRNPCCQVLSELILFNCLFIDYTASFHLKKQPAMISIKSLRGKKTICFQIFSFIFCLHFRNGVSVFFCSSLAIFINQYLRTFSPFPSLYFVTFSSMHGILHSQAIQEKKKIHKTSFTRWFS